MQSPVNTYWKRAERGYGSGHSSSRKCLGIDGMVEGHGAPAVLACWGTELLDVQKFDMVCRVFSASRVYVQ